MTDLRALVAGIGNVFLGDDGFGVEVVRRLAERPLPEGVHVVDFGIRGIDLVYALQDGYPLVVLVDSMPRGRAPGTLYVLEPEIDRAQPALAIEGHSLDPAQILSLVARLGTAPRTLRVVGCEPGHVPSADEIEVGLSDAVAAAVPEAVCIVERLLGSSHARARNR